MTNNRASQWDTALASVERVAMATLDSLDGNIFDPRTNLAPTIAALRTDQSLAALVRESGDRVPADTFATLLPTLVEDISLDRRRVMTTNHMCERAPALSEFGVQHCESRIIVHAYRDYDGFVTAVVAKPYEHTICRHPAPHGPIWRHPDAPCWYHRYVLLGIGARVFARAAELVPGARWKVGPLTPYSVKLRAKLHQAAPWQWQFNGCDVCRGVVDWERTAEGDFPPH